MDLALQGHRIDDGADVVDDDVADQRDGAGLGVDLRLAHVAAVGPGVGRGDERPRLVQPGLETLRQLAGLERGAGDVRERDRAVGPGHPELAVGEHDVLLGRL